MLRSKTLKLVLLEGTPFGVKIVELSNWNGKAIIAPRAALKRLKELPEAGMPAVYFLLGNDHRVYVGETDELGKRLARHATDKEFWTDIIAFTSSRLTKTEVKYLEYAFTNRLQSDGLATLENGVTPRSPVIAPEDQDVLEEFIDRASDVLFSLGFALLGASPEAESAAKESGIAVHCTGPDANARGIYGENGLLVLKDSIARKQATDTFPSGYNKTREQMIQSGILTAKSNAELVFDQDYLFSSASAAASIVLARSANGLTEWKTIDRKTLKELEQ